MIACASPLYLKRHGTPAVPADLAAHQVIGYSHLPDARLWQFHGTGRSEAPQVTARLTLNNGEAMRDMALAGLGLAMLPDFIVAPALREGRLLQVLAAHETRILPIHAVWPPISPIPVKLRALIEHLAAALAGGRPWNQPDKA
jgi:DNA-binding transcriptional LysR family regulator